MRKTIVQSTIYPCEEKEILVKHDKKCLQPQE